MFSEFSYCKTRPSDMGFANKALLENTIAFNAIVLFVVFSLYYYMTMFASGSEREIQLLDSY